MKLNTNLVKYKSLWANRASKVYIVGEHPPQGQS